MVLSHSSPRYCNRGQRAIVTGIYLGRRFEVETRARILIKQYIQTFLRREELV